MKEKNAIFYMLASKRENKGTVDVRHIRATGVVVRSTKVMVTERRDVPVVQAAKRK